MKTYAQKITDYFEGEWEIESKETSDLDWWADEIWKLSSNWSPQGSTAYVTFLVDPMHEGKREKGQNVWGLGCSKNHPQNRVEAESGSVISFGKSFKNEFLDFSLKLDELREIE